MRKICATVRMGRMVTMVRTVRMVRMDKVDCFTVTVWKWGNPQCFHLPLGFHPWEV